jgi:hypothetical protein
MWRLIFALVSVVFSLSTATAQGQPVQEQSGPAIQSFATRAAGRSVRGVKVRLNRVRIKLGLAHGRVGRTESLAGIAQRYGAVAAINGSYFNAYTSNPIKNPSHTLATDGQVVHKGNIGSVLYITADKRAHIARVPLKIEGNLDSGDNYADRWYAFWLNRLPENSSTITIFTPYWGKATGLNDGLQVVVSKGVVTRISGSSQVIPNDGYVIYFRGQESLARRFRVGRRCEYRIVREDAKGLGSWAQMREAIGCGPQLLTNGHVTVDPVAEGFRDPKVITGSMQRSVVGITRDGWLILAIASGTMRQMAEVMKALGAYQAMNLDSAASSGLWIRDRYLARPGRLLSNALLVILP